MAADHATGRRHSGPVATADAAPTAKKRRRKPAFLTRNYALALALAERMHRREMQKDREDRRDRFTVADITREMFDVSEMLYGRRSSPLLMTPGTTYRALAELVKRGYLDRVRDDARFGGLDSFALTEMGSERAPLELTTLTTRSNPPIPPDPQVLVDFLNAQHLDPL